MLNTLQMNATLTEEHFRLVSDAIYKHCGINLHDGKKALVRARLAKRLRESRYESFDDYLEYAFSEQGKDEFTNLVDSISTNLTSFFRERVHFDYMQETLLPKLIETGNRSGRRHIRGWSAGCSSGEEPYTIAITLLEGLQGERQNWDAKILASDVSTRILARAKAGVYDSDRIAPLTPQQRSRFLSVEKTGAEKAYRVNPALQRLIAFRYLNLMEQWPFRGPFDFIFCRNVMIYFDKPTQERLVNRFYDVLASGGVLFIGHSESLTGAEHKFRYVMPATYARP